MNILSVLLHEKLSSKKTGKTSESLSPRDSDILPVGLYDINLSTSKILFLFLVLLFQLQRYKDSFYAEHVTSSLP